MYRPHWEFHYKENKALLCTHFQTTDLQHLDIVSHVDAIKVAGAILRYTQHTQRTHLSHLKSIQLEQTDKYLILDSGTQQNLEVC